MQRNSKILKGILIRTAIKLSEKLLFGEEFRIGQKAPLCKGSWIGEAKTEGL